MNSQNSLDIRINHESEHFKKLSCFLDMSFCKAILTLGLDEVATRFRLDLDPRDEAVAKRLVNWDRALKDSRTHYHIDRSLGDFVYMWSWCIHYLDMWCCRSSYDRFISFSKYSDNWYNKVIFELVFRQVQKLYGMSEREHSDSYILEYVKSTKELTLEESYGQLKRQISTVDIEFHSLQQYFLILWRQWNG